MLPVSLFLMLVGGWLAFRAVLFLDARLVRERSRGFRCLMAVGGVAYGMPALLDRRLWAWPLIALSVCSASSLVDLRWPMRWLRQRAVDVRRRGLPDNVVPLRSP